MSTDTWYAYTVVNEPPYDRVIGRREEYIAELCGTEQGVAVDFAEHLDFRAVREHGGDCWAMGRNSDVLVCVESSPNTVRRFVIEKRVVYRAVEVEP